MSTSGQEVRFCAACGTPLRGTAFCTACGTPAGSASRDASAPAGARPPPEAAAEPSSGPHSPAAPLRAPRRRAPWLVAAVAGLLLALACTVALAVPAVRSRLAEPHDVVGTPAAGSGSGGAASDASPSAPPSTSTSASTSGSGTAAPVTCWDGSGAASGAACSLPSGMAGLAWVFPSFDESACRAVPPDDPDETTVWECREHDGSGQLFVVRYAVFTSTAAALARFDGTGTISTVSNDAGEQIRRVWRSSTSDGQYVLATCYLDYPYALTITAPTLTTRENAYASSVGFRRPQFIRVQP